MIHADPASMTHATAIALPRRVVRDTRARATVIWAGIRLGLHVLAAIARSLGGGAGGVPVFGVIPFLWIVGVVSALVQADVSVCRESTLLANLGVSRVRVFALALPAILVPEIAWQLALLLFAR